MTVLINSLPSAVSFTSGESIFNEAVISQFIPALVSRADPEAVISIKCSPLLPSPRLTSVNSIPMSLPFLKNPKLPVRVWPSTVRARFSLLKTAKSVSLSANSTETDVDDPSLPVKTISVSGTPAPVLFTRTVVTPPENETSGIPISEICPDASRANFPSPKLITPISAPVKSTPRALGLKASLFSSSRKGPCPMKIVISSPPKT